MEPGTSKNSSNCLLLKNSRKDGNIARDENYKKAKRDLIESLVSEAANRLNVQYVTKKKVKDKKRKSCSAILEKPKSNKRLRISCEARICDQEEINVDNLNQNEPAQDLKVNDYVVMVNKQLKALQELPVTPKSSMSEIQVFISKLDESQVENFLRKKAEGIQSSGDSDPNAKSILSFIQKKIDLPVCQNSSSIEVVDPSNNGDDTSLAGPSNYNCSEKLEDEKNSKSDVTQDLVSSNHGDCMISTNTSSENSKVNTQEILRDAERYEQKSDKGTTKSEIIKVMDTNDDVTEVTSTSENEITSFSELKIIQSEALEKLNSIDLFKLNQKDLTEFIVPLLAYKDGESNSNSVLLNKAKESNLEESSEQEMKVALKKNIQNFFLQLISFADMLKTCTDIIGRNSSDEEAKPKVELVEKTCLSTEQTPNSTEKSLNKIASKKLNSHCGCCALKSKENNSEEDNSTLKVTEGKPSNSLNLKNNTLTSESPENLDISSTTTLDAQSVSPVTSSSTVVTTTESEKVKDEIPILLDDLSDDALEESKDDTPIGGVFKCKKCNYSTKSKLKLKRHVKYAKKNPLMYNHKRKAVKTVEN